MGVALINLNTLLLSKKLLNFKHLYRIIFLSFALIGQY